MVQAELSPATLLPMLSVHTEDLKEAWEHPASVGPSSRWHDALYKVDKAAVAFLFSHPIPNSMIFHSSAKSKGAKPSRPPDRESRKEDSIA